MNLRTTILAVTVALAAAGCSSAVGGSTGRTTRPSTGVIVVGDRDDSRGKGRGKANGHNRAPRKVKIPPGHYPPKGMCRLWYPGRPPGQQPAPFRCGEVRGRVFGSGAFLLYGGRPWDADYDWRDDERRRPGSVPRVVIHLLFTGR